MASGDGWAESRCFSHVFGTLEAMGHGPEHLCVTPSRAVSGSWMSYAVTGFPCSEYLKIARWELHSFF